MMRRVFLAAALCLSMVMLAGVSVWQMMAAQLGGSGPVFPDVPFTHLYSYAIHTLHDRGIVSGNADGTFRPDSVINRAEFTKIIIAARFSETEMADCIARTYVLFPDVRLNDWFAPYVCIAKEKGIVRGYADGYFRPEQTINIAESSQILASTFGLSAKKPVTMTEWYAPAVQALADHSIYPPSVRALEQNPTRGEMAEMIVRILTVSSQPATHPAATQYTSQASSRAPQESLWQTQFDILQRMQQAQNAVGSAASAASTATLTFQLPVAAALSRASVQSFVVTAAASSAARVQQEFTGGGDGFPPLPLFSVDPATFSDPSAAALYPQVPSLRADGEVVAIALDTNDSMNWRPVSMWNGLNMFSVLAEGSIRHVFNPGEDLMFNPGYGETPSQWAFRGLPTRAYALLYGDELFSVNGFIVRLSSWSNNTYRAISLWTQFDEWRDPFVNGYTLWSYAANTMLGSPDGRYILTHQAYPHNIMHVTDLQTKINVALTLPDDAIHQPLLITDDGLVLLRQWRNQTIAQVIYTLSSNAITTVVPAGTNSQGCEVWSGDLRFFACSDVKNPGQQTMRTSPYIKEIATNKKTLLFAGTPYENFSGQILGFSVDGRYTFVEVQYMNPDTDTSEAILLRWDRDTGIFIELKRPLQTVGHGYTSFSGDGRTYAGITSYKPLSFYVGRIAD